jgi:4-alpha-glucanotransferase
MDFPRASGLLLHPTSLPGEYGVGDLGPEAHMFVDLLKRAGQTYWQILPLGPTGYGDSPYQSFSAFAGNTLLISPAALLDDGLIDASDLAAKPDFPTDRVDHGAVYRWKSDLLRTVYSRFKTDESGLRAEFDAFSLEQQFWLDDYSLYRALKISQDERPWYEWPDKFKLRDKRTLDIAKEQLAPDVDAEQFYQFLFFRQWAELKRYAADKGVKFIGDIPIFVALDSCDVWSDQDKFKLNSDGTAKVVAGVPPDYFSKTGQLWGNPIYDWDAMRTDGFRWWTDRFRAMLKMVDIVRVDHFRGFAAAWEVPGGDATAEHGQWVPAAGMEIFDTLKLELGELPIIAEDLGVVTPEVEELRDRFGFPGMRILQYAFSGDAENHDLPHNYVHNCVAYTGTHDNDTAAGWWRSVAAGEREYCRKYLDTYGGETNWDMVRAIWMSVADTAIVPVQDVLGLGSDARMNTPATNSGNWSWRMSQGSLTDEMAARLRELTETYGRN